MRVDFIPISLTTPLSSPIIIKSSISKGLSKKILNEAKISHNIFCNAKAIATHITPTLASKGVISTHKLDNSNKPHVI